MWIHYVFNNLLRNPVRLVLNLLSVSIAYTVFGILGAVQTSFEAGERTAPEDRLIVTNRINFTEPLPLSSVAQISSLDGVSKVSHATWFGGYFQDERQPVVAIAVEPTSYLEVYNEISLQESLKQKWYKNKRGAIIGAALAKATGWKIGDVIPLQSNVFAQPDGSRTWELEIVGVFESKTSGADTNYLLFNRQFLSERSTFHGSTVGWVVLLVDDVEVLDAVASEIDSYFDNSPNETETRSERQFNRAFAKQFGDISLIVGAIVGASLFTVLMIVGTSIALSVRERISEHATMIAIGFRPRVVALLCVCESVLLVLLGAITGFLFAYLSISFLVDQTPVGSVFPSLALRYQHVLVMAATSIFIGMISSVLPSFAIGNIDIPRGLSKN